MYSYIKKFYLDREKDIIVSIYKDDKGFYYEITTPNHRSDNLIKNLAKLTKLNIKTINNIKCIREYLQGYVTARNTIVYVLRLGGIKVANINSDGSIEQKATIPAINKTLMSQTNSYKFSAAKTIVKTYIKKENKFKTDLHTHMSGNLSPDRLIALGIYHQIAYPLYYVKKLNLSLSNKQWTILNKKRAIVEKQFKDSLLTGKYLTRKIDDNTFINFADLILNNIENSYSNIVKIRKSLTILKDSQAVFTNLEKLYLYRYVFTKPLFSEKHIPLKGIDNIEDDDIKNYLYEIINDHKNIHYKNNDMLADKLLCIAKQYAANGIKYVEISCTTLVKKNDLMYGFLNTVHKIMPIIEKDTGVAIRFLAAIRRTPLNISKELVTSNYYLRDSLDVLRAIGNDPYIVGCDFVGEEINDIEEFEPLIKEIVKYCKKNPYFTIRFHAGENESFKDNVSNCIKCVKNSLDKGQVMPQIRIGHGVFTADFKSKKGKALIKDLKHYGVILEFQLTSNVRLNNLNNIEEYPIKKYLDNGIKCVVGSDGCGLYGITSLDEQLSVENLINLSDEEIQKITKTEDEVIKKAESIFKTRESAFNKYLNGRSIKEATEQTFKKNKKLIHKLSVSSISKLDSATVLDDKILPLPVEKFPIIIAGGSFNNAYRKTKVNSEGKNIIDHLLKSLDSSKVYFVVGNKMNGYEKYLVDKNKNFDIFAIVPSLISEEEYLAISKSNVKVCISIESLRMAIYKSFNYEIFERYKNCVIVFDGNSVATNLIQEALNGKGKSLIYISKNALALMKKAQSLKGYVKLFDHNTPIVDTIKKFMRSHKS